VRICLISAATVTDFGDHADNKQVREIAEHPPLGILTLAAILREQFEQPAVLDLNRIYYDYLAEGGSRSGRDFCAYAAACVPSGFDVIGFSTICSSYPLTIRMAELVKRAYPETAIIFGGPQASVVDTATLEAFPFVDLIVRGEADETLAKVLKTGLRSPALLFLPGITFRSGGSVVRNPEAPLVADLDALPFPAFDLLPGVETAPFFPLELGRGCPFACTFCSTNDFFRRRFRLKSPDIMLAQMQKVEREYGVRRFDLVHDMFTVDRKRVAAFCHTLLEAGGRYRWGCSARTDCIDDELITLMHRAGCRSVFFGVETGSVRLQRAIDKDLNLPDAAARIASCTAAGMETTVSLITGFPEENSEDLSQTVDFLLDSARYERVEPQLHILSPLAGTPLYNRFRNELLSDDVFSDISYQGQKQEVADLDLIAAFPDIFPNFYGIPVPGLDRRRVKRLRDFVLYGLQRFRSVMVALHQSRGGILSVFEAWEQAFPALVTMSEERGTYYASARFRVDFPLFIRSVYLRGGESDASLDALLQLELGMALSYKASHAGKASKKSARGMVPLPGAGVRLLDFDVDVRAILDQIRRGEGLPAPAKRRVTIATRERNPVGTDIMELTPLSAAFMKLCDGRTLGGVAAALEFDSALESLGREKVCVMTFQELSRQRLLTLHSTHAG
jgi:radical SAM superfamily enzyme YgiQ (UPF0313 family)